MPALQPICEPFIGNDRHQHVIVQTLWVAIGRFDFRPRIGRPRNLPRPFAEISLARNLGECREQPRREGPGRPDTSLLTHQLGLSPSRRVNTGHDGSPNNTVVCRRLSWLSLLGLRGKNVSCPDRRTRSQALYSLPNAGDLEIRIERLRSVLAPSLPCRNFRA